MNPFPPYCTIADHLLILSTTLHLTVLDTPFAVTYLQQALLS